MKMKGIFGKDKDETEYRNGIPPHYGITEEEYRKILEKSFGITFTGKDEIDIVDRLFPDADQEMRCRIIAFGKARDKRLDRKFV